MSNLAEEHANKKRLEEKLAGLKKQKKQKNKKAMSSLGLALLLAIPALLYLWSWVSGIIVTANPVAAAWIFTTGKIAFFFGLIGSITLVCVGFHFHWIGGVALLILALGNFALIINVWTPANVTESGFVYSYDEKTEVLTVHGIKSDSKDLTLDTADFDEDVEALVFSFSRTFLINGELSSLTVRHDGDLTVDADTFLTLKAGRVSVFAESITVLKGAFKNAEIASVELRCEELALNTEAFLESEIGVLTLKDATVTTKKNIFKKCEIGELVLDGAIMPVGKDALANGKKQLFSGCDEFALTLRNGAQTAYFIDTIERLTLSDTSEIRLACYYMDAGRHVQVVVEEAVLTEDFTGKLINYRNNGVWQEKVMSVALAKKIYIPRALSALPEDLFGDTGDGCTVYFEGSESEWNALIGAMAAKGKNYEEGRVNVLYNQEHAAWN